MSQFERDKLDAYIKALVNSKQARKSDQHQIALSRINKKKSNNKEFSKKISDAVKQQYSDPGYRDFRQQILKEVAQTDEWKKAHSLGIEKRKANGWEQKNADAAKKKRKPIQTPYGLFGSKKEAVIGMTQAGVINAGGKLSVWIKTNPKEYYYV